MNKNFGFVFIIFFSLVAVNILISAISNGFPVLPSVASGQTLTAANTADIDAGSSSGCVSFVDTNLFSKDGSGQTCVTQGYGRTPYSYLYPNDWHDGIDIAAPYGSQIYSPNSGIVLATGDQDDYCYRRGFGKYIAVHDPVNNLVLWYAHLGDIDVSPGETIRQGDEIGTIGATGLETGAHLHFSIFEASGFTMTSRDGCGPEPTGQDLDPLDYLGTTYR